MMASKPKGKESKKDTVADTGLLPLEEGGRAQTMKRCVRSATLQHTLQCRVSEPALKKGWPQDKREAVAWRSQ